MLLKPRNRFINRPVALILIVGLILLVTIHISYRIFWVIPIEEKLDRINSELQKKQASYEEKQRKFDRVMQARRKRSEAEEQRILKGK